MLCVHSRDADMHSYQQGIEEEKQQEIEEKFAELCIDEDTLLTILERYFSDSVDCCAVVKAKEDNYAIFMKLSDALNNFVFEIALKDIQYL